MSRANDIPHEFTPEVSNTYLVDRVPCGLCTVASLLLILVNRSARPFGWRVTRRANPLLLAIVGISVLLQVAIVSWPPLQALFQTTALRTTEWMLVLGLAVASTVWFEAVKMIAGRQPH